MAFHRAALGAGVSCVEQRGSRFADAPADDGAGYAWPIVRRHQRCGHRTRRESVERNDRRGLAVMREGAREHGRARKGGGRRLGVNPKFGQFSRVARAKPPHDR